MGSKHDLSAREGAPEEPCAFCHTPHGANPIPGAPLWNRFVDVSQTHTLYQSPTLNTSPGNPNSSVYSLLCLGCHDGTNGTAVVNSITGSTKHDLISAPGSGGTPDTTSWPDCRACHGTIYGDPPAFKVGIDLSNDHPVSMTYPTAAQDAAFRTPPDVSGGWSAVPLFNGRVECASCHDVHDPGVVPFLRTSNVGSALCLTCHIK